jgi:hypothetical protein
MNNPRKMWRRSIRADNQRGEVSTWSPEGRRFGGPKSIFHDSPVSDIEKLRTPVLRAKWPVTHGASRRKPLTERSSGTITFER